MLPRLRLVPVALLASALVVAAAACDTGDGKALREPTEAQRAVLSTTTTSTTTTTTSTVAALPSGGATTSTTVPATTAAPFELTLPWGDGGAIDARFTCDGEDRSPALRWTAPPAGTIELALLVTDDDANDFVHWVVGGIAPLPGESGEGATITGGLEGVNGFGDSGWGGPCPPPGSPHTYRFTLYALNQQAELAEGFTGEQLRGIAEVSSIAVTEATGTYSR